MKGILTWKGPVEENLPASRALAPAADFRLGFLSVSLDSTVSLKERYVRSFCTISWLGMKPLRRGRNAGSFVNLSYSSRSFLRRCSRRLSMVFWWLRRHSEKGSSFRRGFRMSYEYVP